MNNPVPKIKKWFYSPHALKRIMERKITAEELSEVIKSPEFTIPQGPKWIFSKSIQGRTDNQIAAVLMERMDKELWVIITVMIRFEKK